MNSILLASAIYLISAIAVLWTAGAIYYDVARASRAGTVLAVAWVVLALAALILWQPVWKPFLCLVLFEGVFLTWWLSQRPSHDRDWNANFSQLPSVAVEGDWVTIENVRNTEYRSLADNTPRFETRRYQLSNLRGIDLLFLNWGSPWMSHPMFVFDFGVDGRVCISIEIRYRAGQKFSVLRSLYRRQELMFVVTDERDAILRRTKCMPNHNMYLYHMDSDAVVLRRFFFAYATGINSLVDHPRWYHGITANCTTSIYALVRGYIKWDWRLLVNGSLDRLMYDHKWLDQHLPFEELKQQSWVNEVANAAPADDFSNYIRQHLPGYQVASP